MMHEDIVEHISYERGKNEESKKKINMSAYDIGVEDGRKRAWDLLGEAAKWYDDKIKEREKTDRPPDDFDYVARYETCLYLQQVIKRDSFI